MKKKTLVRWLIAAAMVVAMVPLYAVAQTTSPLAQGEEVNIPDPNFRAVLNDYIGQETDDTSRPANAPITQDEMASLRNLYFGDEAAVTDITGIQYATSLQYLDITGTVKGLEEISNLENLMDVYIRENEDVNDFAFLGNKPHLYRLFISFCPNLTSLSGLTYERFPTLGILYLHGCESFYDLSILSEEQFPELWHLDLYDCDNITDISPLKSCPSLTSLDLGGLYFDAENREHYRSTIASLTSLTQLTINSCGITDADAQVMFPPLSKLEELALTSNYLTNVEFLNSMSADLTALGLYGNNITDMSPVGRFRNLKALDLGSNNVTDFSFISQLPNLTSNVVDSTEGLPSYPAISSYYVGEAISPVEVVNGTITLPNPYVGADGHPVPFTEAYPVQLGTTIPDPDATYTISYNEDANTITLKNVTGTVRFCTTYTLPLPGNDSKVLQLYFQVYTTEHRHTWGQPTYTWAEDGSSCTASRVCLDDATHVETVTAVISQEQTLAPTCTQMGETTYTATFAEYWAATQTLTLADVPQLPHSSNGTWHWDETNHFHICEVDGEHFDVAAHTFQWVTDSQTGEQYQQCTVCGYQLSAEALPTPSATPQPNQPPQTGDTASVLPWASALVVGFALLPALIAWKRKAN